MFKACIAFVILLILIQSSVSCAENTNSNVDPEISSIQNIPANEIIFRSSISMNNVESFSFKLTHEKGSGTFIDGLLLTDASGHVTASNDLHVETNMLLGNLSVKGGIINLGTRSFILNPLTNTWTEVTVDSVPFGFFDPKSGLNSMLENAENLKLVSSTSRWYEIVGNISAKSLSAIVGTTTENNVTIMFRVNKDDFRINKVEVTGKLTEDDREDITRTIRISGFDEKLEIHDPNS